jgi:hypothetical protein
LSYLERLQQARDINNTVLSSTENTVNSLSERSGTATTNTGFENPYGDIESLRWKVDQGMASRLMQKDLGEAANVFAYKDAKQDVDANPFAVQQMAHQYRMQEVASANASRERAARMKTETEVGKDLVATGGWKWDKDPRSATYNQAIPKDEANILSVRQKDKGTSTDIVNLNEQSAKYTSKQVTDKVVPYMTSMLVSIRDLQKQGKLSNQDIKKIFGNTNMTPEKLNEQLKESPYKLITSTLGTTKLKQITNGFQAIIKQNYDKGIKGFDVVGQQMSNYNIGLNDYYTYTSDLQNWRKGSKDAVVDHVKGSIDKDLKNYVNKMFSDDGSMLSKAAFAKKIGRTVTGLTNIHDLIASNKPAILNVYDIQDTRPQTVKKNVPDLYDELKTAIHKAYGSTNVKFESAPPMLSSIGQFKDAGLTTIGEHGMDVYPDDVTSAGAFHFNSFKNNINSLDFNSDVTVSFKGATATAPNRNKEGNVLMQEIFRETSQPNSKFKGFRIAAQPLAQNKAGKGAMIIYPDAEWLKKHTYTEKGEGDKKTRSAGTISQDQANLILRNGITLISDEKNWNNSLYEATQVTPFQAHVNYSKDPVVLDDPNDDSGMNSISFKKDDILGGYNYSYKYKSWNPEKNTYEQKEVSDQIYSGAELEDVRARAYAGWPNNTKTNNEIFNSNK